MLKKIGLILLVVAMITMLAACDLGSDSDVDSGGTDAIGGDYNNGGTAADVDPMTLAFDTYSDIMTRMSIGQGQSGAFDTDFTMVMEMEMAGESMVFNSNGNIKMIVDGKDMQISSVMSTDMGGLGVSTVEMHVTMADGEITDMRTVMDGMEMPSDVDMMNDMSDSIINMPDVSEEIFNSVEIEEVNGNTVMNIVLDGQALADFSLANMDTIAMFSLGDMELSIDGVLLTIVTDSAGNPLSMTMIMSMWMTEDGEEFTVRSTTEYTFNAFDDSVAM